MSSQQSHKGRKLKTYTVKEKLAVVETARRISKSEAVRRHDVNIASVVRWCKQEQDLLKLLDGKGSKAQRLSGGGRPLTNPAAEKEITGWLKFQREVNR